MSANCWCKPTVGANADRRPAHETTYYDKKVAAHAGRTRRSTSRTDAERSRTTYYPLMAVELFTIYLKVKSDVLRP